MAVARESRNSVGMPEVAEAADFPRGESILETRHPAPPLSCALDDEGDGWVNWSGLATLVPDVPDLVASSLNRLVPRWPLWQNDADDLTREPPVL